MTTSTKLQPQATGRNQPPPDEAPALPLLLRIKDVMRELAVSRRTVYELVKDGKLHLVRVGIRGSRIRTEEVLKLAGCTFMPLRIPRLRNHKDGDAEADDRRIDDIAAQLEERYQQDLEADWTQRSGRSSHKIRSS